jgi:hypothetical protein
MPMAATAKLGMDRWGAVAALGRLVGLADLLGQLGVGCLPLRRDTSSLRVVGGTGDSSSSHARVTVRCCAFSASMNG